jgi:hypothetical protein
MKSNAKIFMPVARIAVGVLLTSLMGVATAQTAAGPVVATLGKVPIATPF